MEVGSGENRGLVDAVFAELVKLESGRDRPDYTLQHPLLAHCFRRIGSLVAMQGGHSACESEEPVG